MQLLRFFSFLILGIAWTGMSFGATNPYAQPNNSWIVIDGKVKSVEADQFILEYGKGSITVEMDDGDRDADGYKLFAGDKVSVSGMIDDDFFEKRTIEASSVYVENIGTTFYASALDDEDMPGIYYQYQVTPIVPAHTLLTGTVSSIDGRDFVLNTGKRKVTVDTNTMSNNPLDKKGYLQVSKGDIVSVSGVLTATFLDGRELVADTIVRFYDNGKKQKKKSKSDGKS